jgi:hypothetical protein
LPDKRVVENVKLARRNYNITILGGGGGGGGVTPSIPPTSFGPADKAEEILLQDFRFSEEPAPKNHFANDAIISSDVPIFATSKAPIVYIRPYNVEDERETEMVNSRWRMILFKHAYEEKDEKKVKPFRSCFARLVLLREK